MQQPIERYDQSVVRCPWIATLRTLIKRRTASEALRVHLSASNYLSWREDTCTRSVLYRSFVRSVMTDEYNHGQERLVARRSTSVICYPMLSPNDRRATSRVQGRRRSQHHENGEEDWSGESESRREKKRHLFFLFR